ncbi:MAG TPA: AMP-binding protein [Kofleriaceae bacterium]|jgi:acyl-CoA synthetase (AMP-forming)/AMP-acid ligase II|nr:AMP-binding protein [Kofleriaceae bacterium]
MVLASRYTSRPIPDVSLPQYVRDAVSSRAGDVAVIDGPTGRSYTFGQVLDHAASIAHGLIARGIAPGDRVAFLVPNLPEVALAFHGVLAAGAIAMMVNPLSTGEELAKYFKVGSPRLVIAAAPLVGAVQAVAPGLPVIALGDAPGSEPLTALLGGSTVPPAIAIAPDAVAVMPYSSGTTGFPKGVMLTHRNLIAQCLAIESVTDADLIIPGSAVLAVLPFFHIYGIMAFLTFGLMRGARLITIPRFDLEQYIQLARRHEVPVLHVVPPILLALAKYPGELQLPHLRAALVGAAPLSAELAAEFTARTGAMIYQAYGMTEVSGASHLGSLDPARNKPGSAGGLIGHAEARVVAIDSGADVAPGERGEIWVRGPFMMKGYFEDPAATAHTIDRDGWLHTGDIGYVDADGDFWVVDRVKELIKYKGMQVAPAELEAVLLQHPAVADCGVYAQPDDEAGELPKAAVVLKRGASATAEELLQFVSARVSPHKRVRVLRFVDAIPKSASGKILRRVLVAQDRG